MSKYILHVAVIFIANILISVLVSLAIFSFLFNQDVILTGMFALIAFPGILLQPWSIPILLWSKGILFSPFITTTITVLVYRGLQDQPWMKRLRSVFSSLTLQKFGWGIFAVVSGMSLVTWGRFKDIPPLKTGIPKAGSYRLKTSLPKLIRQRGRYYQLPSFLDKEGLWQVQVSDEELKTITTELSLVTASKQDVPPEFNGMPPYWWRPVHQNSTQYFATPDFSETTKGTDGFHAIALWNPGDQLFYLWYNDNF